jgi:phosphoglycerate kinase
MQTLNNLNASNKHVLVRLDLNLPVQKGQVTDFTRLERSLPSLRELIGQGAKVIIMAHLGRPRGHQTDFSLFPIFQALKNAMTPTPVFFCKSAQGPLVKEAIASLKAGEILLLENIRFVPGEEKNDPSFAKEMASWGDVYVNDAFSAAHRAHVSTEAIAHLLPSYAGRLMEEEVGALQSALENPKKPLMAIVGGAKISTKLPLLDNLLKKVDSLVICGAMANTFLAARGEDIGASLYEPDLLDTARDILKYGPNILLPQDMAVAKSLEDTASLRICSRGDVRKDEKIFDIGPFTCQQILEKMKECHTLVWNGPLGVFETPPFDQGTIKIAQGVAKFTQEGSLYSIAGGGDTVAALSHAGVLEKFTYVSTAGGAFLEWLEGKSLPGVKVLE